ncbi:MAG: glucose-1-phosphate adenylyltransferase [Saprospiraceae bacterium]
MIKMIAMILGGGAGSRLFPLTEQRSKPAVPIGGKYRLIDIPISNCLNSGLKRMFVLTQFNSASLNQHIKNTYNFDSFGHGFVDILAAEQTVESENWFQGTADAVKQCMHHLTYHEYDYILILSGDQLYQLDFEQLANYHIKQGADLTVATIPVNARDAEGFGIMKVNADGLIDSFIEKPSGDKVPNWKSEVGDNYRAQGKEYLASMGIYMFNKASLKKLFVDNDTATDFGKEIIPKSIKSGYKVASYAYGGYWEDIGTIRSFFQANLELTDNLPNFNLFDNQNMVYTRPRMLPPSKFFGTQFRQAVIAEGCIIHAKKIERSIIGIRSRIGEDSVLKNVIIMGNDYFETLEDLQKNNIPMGIGQRCHIENAIIDKSVHIGDDVLIHGHDKLEDKDTDTYCVRDGIIVLRKGAVIPSGMRIG